MKKYLYVIVPLCKWIVNTLMVIFVFNYLYTNPINAWLDLVIGWSMPALIAAPFAYWAFHKKLPTDKQLGIFILFWAGVTVAMEALLTIATWPFFMFTTVIVRYEFLVQLIIEILVILIMARVLRRQQAYHEAVEGIELQK